MLGSCKAGDRVTFFVIDPQLRFKGSVQGDALVITAEDQIIKVVLDPFV
jgi:Mg/Co/Ni transporter MgtE